MKKRFLALDPSVFTSVGRLEDMLKVLRVSKETLIAERAEVILPSFLFHGLKRILDGKYSEELYEIYRAWLPFYPKDHVEAIVRQQAMDKRYRELLESFFKEYAPSPAEEHVRNVERIGKGSIRKYNVREILGKIVGNVVFEMLATADKLKALIISFGQRILTLISRIGVTILRAKSDLKKKIKRHSRVRHALRFTGYALSFDVARVLMNTLGIPQLPFPNDIGLGLLLVANG
jgi:hypothetical protein